MATGLDEKARRELLSKMVVLREAQPKTRDDECKDSSILKRKSVDKIDEQVDKRGNSIVLSHEGEGKGLEGELG